MLLVYLLYNYTILELYKCTWHNFGLHQPPNETVNLQDVTETFVKV